MDNIGNDYENILREILKLGDYDNNEIWFLDIYNYLERINQKEIMPYVLKDIKKTGLSIIFNRVTSEYNRAMHNRI